MSDAPDAQVPAGDNHASVIELRGVGFAYPMAAAPVLEAVDLALMPGQRLGLFGPNGCGKTTLLSVMTGLRAATSGQILHRGNPVRSEEDFAALRREMGLLLQNADDQILFPTVLDDVAFGPLNLGMKPSEAEAEARRALEFVGLSGFDERLAHKLSGGEKKLVTLAGVLAMRPKALLLDEPTASLDPATRDRLAHILSHLDAAVLTVSHDWDFLNLVASEYYTIENGRLVREAATQLHWHAHAHPHPEQPH
jgi:cobalt/nickel transport system ATP-binding protein